MVLTVWFLCICVILQAWVDSSAQEEKRNQKVHDGNRPICNYSPTIYTSSCKFSEDNEKLLRDLGNKLSIIDTKIENLHKTCSFGPWPTGSSVTTATPKNSPTTTAPTILPRDCSDIQKAGLRRNGVYKIYPERTSSTGITVSCDFTTDGGGWTVFQRRQDGSVDFFRGWNEYRTGFGNKSGEFWLGNDNIHRLTVGRLYKLRVDIQDWNGSRRFAEYNSFYIDGAKSKYKLHVSGYRGDAGDSLSYHNNVAFSTKDQDNDSDKSNCAKDYKGAWWQKACFYSNLNGFYYKTAAASASGVCWYHYKNKFVSLKFSEMKVRPLHFGQ